MKLKLSPLITFFVVLATLLNGVTGVMAHAANSTPLPFTETFVGSSLNDPSNWVASATGDTTFAHPCLTAASPSSTIALGQSTTIKGCGAAQSNTDGNGALILTTANGNQTATMLYNKALPTSGGMEIAFFESQYGGTNADGISFFTKNGTNTILTTGVAGGGLGYKGLPGGLFGVGFDRFGNWLNQSGSMDSACTNPGPTPYAIAVRGPDTSATGDGSVGFCPLGGGAVDPAFYSSAGDTRLQAARPIRIIVDPSTATTPKIHVYVWKTGGLTQDTITADFKLEVDEPAQYKAVSTFKFGFSASTGGANDNHAIWGLSIKTTTPTTSPVVYVVPQNSSVNAGDVATYAAPKYFKDAAHTTEFLSSELTPLTASTCTSTYTTAVTTPTTLPITCSGGGSPLYAFNSDASATLTVNKGTPKITPATQTLSGTTNSAFTASAAYTAVNFTAAPTYGIAPTLPAGLNFSSSTGVITGTPTAASAATTYTVTAANGTEQAMATLSVAIADKAKYPYAISFEANGGSGTMTGLTGVASSVTLPANSFTRTNYVFNGWKDDAIVSYTNKQVIDIKDTLSLVLHAQWSQSLVTLTPSNQTITTTVNSAIAASATYVATGFTTGDLKYSISPALPAGLSFNTSTGVITGTPSAVIALQQFTVTASDKANSATATISVSASAAAVVMKSIQPAVQTITGYVGIALIPSTAYTTAGFTGALTYSIAPALPAGLSITATTGVISGTPTAIMASTNYAVTGSNASESGTVAVSIQVATGGATHLYAISFDPNGGQGLMAGLTGDSPTVVLTKNAFTLPSMTWTGWKDDSGKIYADGDTVNVMQKLTLVLHAQWKLNDATIGDFSKPVPVVPGATQPVSFALDSNKLSAQSLGVLAKWNLNAVAAITISGFAQPGGGSAYNMKLSKQRAQSAAAVMAKQYKGLKISIVGMGETFTKKCIKYKNKCAMITIMIMKDGRRA